MLKNININLSSFFFLENCYLSRSVSATSAMTEESQLESDQEVRYNE